MSGLVKNEMIKTGKSGIIRAAIAVIIALCIILPIGSFLMSGETTEIINDYEKWAQNADDEVEKAYYTALSRTEQFFIDNGIGYNDWRYNRYYYDLSSLERANAIVDLVMSGAKRSDVENYFMYEDLNIAVDIDKDDNVVFSEEDYIDPFEMNETELKMQKEKTEKLVSELRKTIASATIYDMYKQNLERCQESATFAQTALNEAEAKLAENPENIRFEYERDQAKGELETADLQLWGAMELEKNGYEYDSWQYNAINNILSNAAFEYSRNVKMSEKLFKESDEANYYKTYQAYCDSLDSDLRRGENAISIIRYSLEHDIPLPETLEDSARDGFIDNLGFAVLLVGILMVAVAGTTLFSEYSGGSIRLLLIRPKSRSKILLSKLITVIIYGVIMMTVSAVLLFVLNMFCHADKDMFVPFITTGADGAVSVVPTVLYALVRTATKLFSSFAVVAGAFMLSAIFAKGGIFSLMAGPVALGGASLARIISAEINPAFRNFAAYTILPYLDLSVYFGNPVADYASGGFTIFDELFGTSGVEQYFNLKTGCVIVAVHIAVFLAAAFIGFRKKQIKN